jgi:hypothetical protein
VGEGGGQETDAAGLSYHIYWRRVWGEGGEERAGRGENKYVLALNATCMHIDVSLSHISVLLLQPLSI